MTRRAISPPPGSVQVPRLASLRAPTDMVPTIAPAAIARRRRELEEARRALVTHADHLRETLLALGCHPYELTSVLAAIDHVLDEGEKR